MALKPSASSKSLVASGAAPAVRRQYKVRALAVALFAVLLMWARYQQTLTSSGRKGPLRHAPAAGALLRSAESAFTLQFEVCNGFTNQRIALMTGLVLAAISKRTVVLPEFLLDGMQPDDMHTVTADEADTVPFREWFDEQAFAESLAAHGVQVAGGRAPNATLVSVQEFDSNSKPSAIMSHFRKHKAHKHIRIPCPAFRIPGSMMRKHAALLRAAVEGLQPAFRFQALLAARRRKVEALTGLPAYNLLHLRVEKDWFALCKLWENPGEGRNNCMNNTATVGRALQRDGFDPGVPLVVVTSWPDAVPDVLEKSLESLKAHNYTVLLGSQLARDGEELTREESAMTDYYLAREAAKFTGNSVSTFTAFLILERQWLGRPSAHYNGGIVPLATFFPLYEPKEDDKLQNADPALPSPL